MSFKSSRGELSKEVYLPLLFIKDKDKVILPTIITDNTSDWVSGSFKAIILFF